MAMVARVPVVQRQLSRPGVLVRLIGGVARLLSLLVLALCFSVLLEWIGMLTWWPEQGVRHSERMLAQELEYLNMELQRSVLPKQPGELGQSAAMQADKLLRSVGVDSLIVWLKSSSPSEGWSATFHDLGRGSARYVEAMANIAQTFAVRLTVLLFATPVFLLFGLVGVAEGLMRRDLRRWGGGRESSFVYHHSKKLLAPSVISACMLYLAMPFSLHPNWVLLPFAALFAVGIAMTMTTFKKYL